MNVVDFKLQLCISVGNFCFQFMHYSFTRNISLFFQQKKVKENATYAGIMTVSSPVTQDRFTWETYKTVRSEQIIAWRISFTMEVHIPARTKGNIILHFHKTDSWPNRTVYTCCNAGPQLFRSHPIDWLIVLVLRRKSAISSEGLLKLSRLFRQVKGV